MTTTPELTDTEIAIKDLALHDLNARAGSPETYEADDIPVLAASIATLGLLNPLIVQKTGKVWGVIAGGRRRAALVHLVNDAEAKGWTQRTKVRCRALPDDTAAATAITVAENVTQKPMDPLDEFEAFARMMETGGHSPDSIARMFGVERRRVVERLRFGRIHPDIRAAARARAITLDAMKAFADHPDQAVQKDVFDAMQGGYMQAWTIRDKLRNRGVKLGDAVARLVVEAYRAAEGEIVADLIEEDSILTDEALVERLEPLIARLDDLLRIEARQVEMTERLAFCRLEISKARREIKRLERDLADDPFVEVLIGERAAWVAPRGYQTLAGAEAHLGELDALVRESRRIVGLAVRMTGAAVPDDRCHKQSTTETLSVSCREPVGPEEGGEGEAERSDAGINASFIGCLTVARLRDLASEDLRFYIDHAPADGGPRTISDIDWAVLQRIRDLGIDPSAFEDAVEEMGWLRAMLSLIVIDRNRTHPARPVRSCGGALRAFTSRYLRGELDLRASIFGIWGREGRMH